MGCIIFGLAVALQSPVSLQLVSPKAKFKSGEQVTFSAHAKNLSKQEIELVTEQDSMNWGRKSPLLVLESKQSDGKWSPLVLQGVGRCGNANPLKVADFVTIAPGKSAEILHGMAWTKYEVTECLKAPGTYRIRLRYDSTAKLNSWLGGPLTESEANRLIAEVQPHFNRTPKGVFLSNEVTVTIL